jgi:ABC-type transport system involved in cytochrome c biogenesis ATPase subunit
MMVQQELLALLEMMGLQGQLDCRGRHLGHCQQQFMTMELLIIWGQQLHILVDIITELEIH